MALDIPDQRPAGVGEGARRVADVAAAQLLANTLTDLGEAVPGWVSDLATGDDAVVMIVELDLTPAPAAQLDLREENTTARQQRP